MALDRCMLRALFCVARQGVASGVACAATLCSDPRSTWLEDRFRTYIDCGHESNVFLSANGSSCAPNDCGVAKADSSIQKGPVTLTQPNSHDTTSPRASISSCSAATANPNRPHTSLPNPMNSSSFTRPSLKAHLPFRTNTSTNTESWDAPFPKRCITSLPSRTSCPHTLPLSISPYRPVASAVRNYTSAVLSGTGGPASVASSPTAFESCLCATRALATHTSSTASNSNGNGRSPAADECGGVRGADSSGNADHGGGSGSDDVSENCGSGERVKEVSGGSGGGGGGGALASIQPRIVMVFTCGKCDTRSTKAFSKTSYTKGVVLVRCSGCAKLHLIADHLGWFGEEPFMIHEFAAEQGGDSRRRSSVTAAGGASSPAHHNGTTQCETEQRENHQVQEGDVQKQHDQQQWVDPGLAARTAAAAAAAAASQGGVFELASALQIKEALKQAREMRQQAQPKTDG